MLASIFVVQGLDTLQHPEKVAARAEPVVRPVAERAHGLVPAETEQAVRLNGAVQVVAGTMLGAGILPRLAAFALAGTLVPTTLAGHRFWEAQDPQERAQQRIHFLKNVTMLGGLLVAAADTGDAPSLRWRRRAAQRRAARYLPAVGHLLAASAQAAGGGIATAAHTTAGTAQSAAGGARRAAHTAAGAAAGTGKSAAGLAQRAAQTASSAAQNVSQVAAGAGRRAAAPLMA